MTMTAYHGITLAVIAVVAIGTAMYTYFTTRNRLQAQQEEHRRQRSRSRSRSRSQSPQYRYNPERAIIEDPEPPRRRPGDQETCTICFERLKKKIVRSLPCGHMFHCHCISMWLNTNKSCPVCRQSLV